MACYHPLTAWKSKQVNATGKRSLTFNPTEGIGSSLPLPCGRCIGCKLEYSRQLALRCVHESSLHSDNCFLTLTYRPENLPEGGVLVKKHYVDFMKRLRRWSKRKLLYLMCGEYGELCRICRRPKRKCICPSYIAGPGRPHYHACLFGLDFSDKAFYTVRNGVTLYTSQKLEQLWSHGFCSVGSLTFESAAYVARYVVKKITGDLADTHYTVADPETGEFVRLPPEYSTRSLKPAIGKLWMAQFSSDVYPSDEVVMRGKVMKPPKYYDTLYERAHGADAIGAIKEDRRKFANRNRSNNTPDRLAVREEVKIASINHLKREIE